MPVTPPNQPSGRGQLHRAGVWLLLALSSALLFAQDKPQESKPDAKQIVEIQVFVIRCTNSHKKIDAELKPLAEQLKPLKYTGYTIERKIKERRALNEMLVVDNLGNRKAQITPTARTDERVTFKCEFLKEKEKKPEAKSNFSADSGKFVLQMLPDKDKSGDQLLLAISGR